MVEGRKIMKRHHPLKLVSTLLMFCCLVFLTGINFIVFQDHENKISTSSNIPGKSQEDPSAPVEEKSTERASSVSIQEEYLHEKPLCGIINRPYLLHYSNSDAEKLPDVHFELISPPPDLNTV